MQLRLTAEHQAILKLACMGQYLTNGAIDQQLAKQRGAYGGFYNAFWQTLRTVWPQEVVDKINRHFNFDLSLHEDVCSYLCEAISTYTDHNVILL